MAFEGTFSSLISTNPLEVLCLPFLTAVVILNTKYKRRRRGLLLYLLTALCFVVIEALLVLRQSYTLAACGLALIILARRMCVPAITGGVGSGKSTLAKLLVEQGFVIIDCDAINRELLLPGSLAYASVIRKFGASIVLDNGEIDRNQLREIVFNDESKRLQLNKCLHTYVGLRVISDIFKYRVLQWRRHVVLDIPLLYNTPLVLLTSPVVVVTAPIEDRLRRVDSRETKIPRATFLNIMKVQVPDKVLVTWGDIAIANNGSMESLAEMAEDLASKL